MEYYMVIKKKPLKCFFKKSEFTSENWQQTKEDKQESSIQHTCLLWQS